MLMLRDNSSRLSKIEKKKKDAKNVFIITYKRYAKIDPQHKKKKSLLHGYFTLRNF